VESTFTTLEFDKILQVLGGYAITPMGQEAASELGPLSEDDQIHIALDQTTELCDVIEFDQPFSVDGLYDIRPLLKRLAISSSVLPAQDWLPLYHTLIGIRRLCSYFSSRTEKIPQLKRITSGWIVLSALEKEIDRCIDCDTGEVRDSATPKLASLRKQISDAEQRARRRIESMLSRLGTQGMLQENVISVRDGRLVLVVKEEYKRKIKGLVHDRSASGSSYFIEPLETVEDNNRIRELYAKESQEVQKILADLSDRARADLDGLHTNVDLLKQFELVYAKALLSKRLDAHSPELTGTPNVSLYQGRHPLLLLRLGEKKVVPLDVSLGEKKKSLIISGPNAGGKTVALKTIGLLVLMARSGMHIPALPHSKVGHLDTVFAAIGDQQSIENDLSTFSSHLSRLQDITDRADDKSLVLIDEIGSGTDPDEGAALAMSVLDTLTGRSCLSVVTTHQGSLKAFAFDHPDIDNASMEFDVETLEPTYHLREGIPGSSYAFEIAHRLGLDDHIIDQARTIVGSHKDRFERLLLELEDKLTHYRKLTQEASIKESELRGLTKLYSERSKELKKHEKKLKKQAAAEAEQILKEANATIERTIRELKEQGASKESIRHAKSEMENARKRVETVQHSFQDATKKEPERPVGRGDRVRWTPFGYEGTVVSDVDKQGRVMLQTPSAKFQVPVAELSHNGVSPPPKRRRFVKVDLERSGEYRHEIDLRGMTVDEATESVDKFIDDALLAGFHQVRIIHGKGTGALRKHIGEFLDTHPRVQATRLGNWNEGGTGVTVVEFSRSKQNRSTET
jgi:DNA mismatch repair protein MutS2